VKLAAMWTRGACLACATDWDLGARAPTRELARRSLVLQGGRHRDGPVGDVY